MAEIKSPMITPFLWFEKDGAQGAEYYTSIFPNSKILSISPMVTTFMLDGLRMSILEAGPHHPFNDAVSFFVNCKDQEEVDYFYDRFLADGGKASMCGWLEDKYGVRWQIIPEALMRLSGDPDQAKAKRVINAMLKMKKIIVQDLEEAYSQ